MTDKPAEDKAASWEKTVEWAFVRKYLPNAEFAAPIDGDHEISDAILAQRGQWFLIEFKHTENEFESEIDKYPQLSRNRTVSVLKKNYKTNVSKLKEFNAIRSKSEWRSAYLRYEHELMGGGSAEQFEKDSLLKNATKTLVDLFFKYGKLSSVFKTNLEPHFLVFSRENKFDKLWALPYWINWRKKTEYERGWEAFDPDLIGMYGQNFEVFSDYVRSLAMARGYNIKKLENENQSDFKAIVFGKVSGFSRNRTIAMPLDTFLLIHESLKAAYEASKTVVDEIKATAVHLPEGDTSRP